jgi:polysaccharide biosynthesis transport protein
MKDFRNVDPIGYVKILWRRRWYALAGFVLVSVGTWIYSWRTPDVYLSKATIRVEQTAIPQDYARPSDRSSPEEQIAGIRQQVQSRSFAESLVQEFKLFGYGSGSEFSMDAAIGGLANNIQVVSISGNTFEISTVSPDAQLSQMIVRRVVDTLIQSSSSARKTRAIEVDQFVDVQLRQREQKLLAQEEKIKQFKMAHLGGLPEQSGANVNALSGLNAQLAVVENSLQQIRDQQKQADFRAQQQKQLMQLTQRSILDQLPLSSTAEKATKSPVATNPLLEAKQAELKALSLKYTPNYPDVVRVTREVEELKRQAEASMSQESATSAGGQETAAALEEKSVAGSDAIPDIEAAEIGMQAETYKSEIAKREKERDTLLSQINNYQNRLNLAPALEQEFMGLSREYEILKQQYSDLQRQKFQAETTANLESGKNRDVYRIIDEANLPEKPAFPNRMQIILLGFGAGLVLGIGAAFGRELLDSTLGSEDEAAAILKLPVLVSISEIPPKEPRRLFRIGGMAKSA